MPIDKFVNHRRRHAYAAATRVARVLLWGCGDIGLRATPGHLIRMQIISDKVSNEDLDCIKSINLGQFTKKIR